MKVILTADVKTQGKKGEVIDVSDGYAKNFLIKNGYAIAASASALNTVNQAKAADVHRKKVEKEEALALAQALNKTQLNLCIKVSESGKIFGALTAQMIADELDKQGIKLDKRKIVLDSPIKHTGNYSVSCKLYPEVTALLKVTVSAL